MMKHLKCAAAARWQALCMVSWAAAPLPCSPERLTRSSCADLSIYLDWNAILLRWLGFGLVLAGAGAIIG
jgi:hypothetical protein